MITSLLSNNQQLVQKRIIKRDENFMKREKKGKDV
jgi:hypothetical protein